MNALTTTKKMTEFQQLRTNPLFGPSTYSGDCEIAMGPLGQNYDDDDDDDESPSTNLLVEEIQYPTPPSLLSIDQTRALRILTDAENLDDLLMRIYGYFVEKGFYASFIARLCNLFILAFMVCFSTFTFSCIDHTRIHNHKQLSNVIIPQCLKKLPFVQISFLVVFSIWWLWKLFYIFFELPKLVEIKLIYGCLLEITEAEMDTIEWNDIVHKLTRIKPSLDAHTIVNRIMRKENYLLAMFDKEVLNLRVPGTLGAWIFGRNGVLLTKVIEWNLHFCVLLYAFDEKGELRKRFLKNNYRRRLIVGLQKRFELMAFLNLLFSPFVVVITGLYFCFKYTEEYQKSRSALGARAYTLHARYKLTEFNELPHLFQIRINKSYPLAVNYLEQFRQEKTILIARFVSLIAGAFMAALALLAIVEQELTEFEITQGRSALFYMTLFGGIVAGARGMIPEDTRVFEPERLLKKVVKETHYLPDEWRERLHTKEVKNQFCKLFRLKLTQFLLELVSIPLAPFVLYYSLPKCAEDVVDFFRNYTVEMEGVGCVCSCSAFVSATTGGKMEQSFLHFKAAYPQWGTEVEGC